MTTAIQSKLNDIADRFANAAGDPLTNLRSQRSEVRALLTDLETREKNGKASEAREVRPVIPEVEARAAELDERITELEEQEARAAQGAEARRGYQEQLGTLTQTRQPVYSRLLTRSVSDRSPAYTEPMGATYRRENAHEVSFFRDLYASKRGDFDAIERLHRHRQERAAEQRAGDMSTTAGAGGQFAPPLWLVDDYVKLARASRVTANLLRHQSLPSGVSSINIPKVATGTATAVQSTQNTAVQDTAMTTSSISAGVTTIAGKQIVSLQLMEQSGIPFDEVVLGDLAADAARTLDLQVLNGSGSSGQMTGILTSGAGISFTSASPVVAGSTPANSFQAAVTRAANAVNTTRFLPATVLVMTPTRWAWISEAVDGQGRPLLVPEDTGSAFNSFGVSGPLAAQGAVGRFAGLPVFVDPNIPSNLGAGTNQDVALVMRTDDVWFYESEPRMEAFDATYADQMSLLLRVYMYAVSPLVRYQASVQVIGGTGMVIPTL